MQSFTDKTPTKCLGSQTTSERTLTETLKTSPAEPVASTPLLLLRVLRQHLTSFYLHYQRDEASLKRYSCDRHDKYVCKCVTFASFVFFTLIPSDSPSRILFLDAPVSVTAPAECWVASRAWSTRRRHACHSSSVSMVKLHGS